MFYDKHQQDGAVRENEYQLTATLVCGAAKKGQQQQPIWTCLDLFGVKLVKWMKVQVHLCQGFELTALCIIV